MTHLEKSQELFTKKFHCSQAVLAAFAEELGLTEKQALKQTIFRGDYYGII